MSRLRERADLWGDANVGLLMRDDADVQPGVLLRLLADMGDLLGSRALHTQGTGPCDVCTLLARLRELEERA